MNLFSNQESKKDKGQFFTPKTLVKAIIEQMIPYIKKNPTNKTNETIRILDPAMGEGIFFDVFLRVIKDLPKNDLQDLELYGIDIDPKVVKIGVKKLSNLYNIPKQNLINTNFLLDEILYEKVGKIDVCIGNPPHNARYSKQDWSKIREKINIDSKLEFPSESSIFFVLKCLKLLNMNGILGFIIPKPLVYSKRWFNFRTFLLSECNLLEVLDLGNQFSGQLQEQCFILIEKNATDGRYKTGYWNSNEERFRITNIIHNSNALMFDNLLIAVNEPEVRLIKRFYSNLYENLDVIAFRGINSTFRKKQGSKPLIEKANLVSGFTLPNHNYISENVPKKLVLRQQKPKILAQRIISYKTKPDYRFDLQLWVDHEGSELTHETVINIVPKYLEDTDFSLTAIAGLLRSSFIEWWLRHVVFTKRFVTSKDFDRSYINKIRVPKLSKKGNEDFRNRFQNIIEMESYEVIPNYIEEIDPIDQLYCISELYKKFQEYGEQQKSLIYSVTKKSLDLGMNEDQREKFCILFRKNFRTLKKNINASFPNQFETDKIYEKIHTINQLMGKIQLFINRIVFFLYKITPAEEKIIRGEIN